MTNYNDEKSNVDECASEPITSLPGLSEKIHFELESFECESKARETYFESMRGKLRTISEHNARLIAESEVSEDRLQEFRAAVEKMRVVCNPADSINT